MAHVTRRLILPLAIALVAVLLGPSPAASAGPPSNEDAVGYAAERGISVKEAELRLGWHSAAPDLEERLEVDLGDEFGGIWIDGRTDRAQVGVVKAITTRHVAVIERAAAAVGLAGGYDTVVVQRSWAALQRDNQWLANEIIAVNKDARAHLSAGIRTSANAISLGVPPEADLTSAQLDLVKRARARLGDGVVTKPVASAFRSYACVAPYCDWPLRGNVRINDPGVSWCSSAFVAKSKVDSRKYLMTAGHCINAGGTWQTRDTAAVAKDIGPVWTFYVDTFIGDMAIIRINDAVSWQPQPRIFVPWGPFVTQNDSYPIRADKRSVEGMRICSGGAKTRITTCGEVEELGLTANVDGLTMTNLGYAEGVCGDHGDSGGAMFASHNAYGVLIGGVEGECEIIYQGVRAIESKLNVNVLHA